MGVDPKRMRREEPPFNFRDSIYTNKYFTVVPSEGVVAKMWIMDAEWEMYTTHKKPSYLMGITPMALVFDTYHIYVLKKIFSCKPITEAGQVLTSGGVKFVKNGVIINPPDRN